MRRAGPLAPSPCHPTADATTVYAVGCLVTVALATAAFRAVVGAPRAPKNAEMAHPANRRSFTRRSWTTGILIAKQPL
jgi:hypothetical protein